MAKSSTRSFVSAWAVKPHKPQLLSADFFASHTLSVARDLLGMRLDVRQGRTLLSARIVETEAYRADDPASHSARGQTPRASIMFGDPGVAYVYFIYGNYEMLNFVTESRGEAGAVLIRAVEPLCGLEAMRGRRPKAQSDLELANGPGKLCLALGILRSDNGQSLQGPRLSVLDDGVRPAQIDVSPRVGISVATDNPWRFAVSGHPCVSRAPQNRLFKPLGNRYSRSPEVIRGP